LPPLLPLLLLMRWCVLGVILVTIMVMVTVKIAVQRSPGQGVGAVRITAHL
jgi:hypothetical protein